MMKTYTAVPLIMMIFAGSAYSYGPRGHALVGAIADSRVSSTASTAVKTKLKALLDGLTLQEAATLPDSIKTWDKDPNGFHVTGHPTIETALRAFVAANPAGGSISHHDFHFTDVPVFGKETYSSGQVGRSNFDIVHMIPFCISVLRNQTPETNARKITKPVAVILLAHYLGDIHQPLHVGAEYFTATGTPFDPIPTNKGFADEGGNKLTLFTIVNTQENSDGVLHMYWDDKTVDNAFGLQTTPQIVQQLATTEPAQWKLTGDVGTWAEQLANEILPMAREAHTRLQFIDVKATAGQKLITSGKAEEKTQSAAGKNAALVVYKDWAAGNVKQELQKAGWRLAALLETTLQ
jgi:hypothetical protein